jgi:hypothetical protein
MGDEKDGGAFGGVDSIYFCCTAMSQNTEAWGMRLCG